MRIIATICLLLGFSFSSIAQSEARQKELTEQLQKELKVLAAQVAELSKLMAQELEDQLNEDSLKVRIEESKQAIKETAVKIKAYSKELSEDYDLTDEQKELLRKSARAFNESMRSLGEALSSIARDLSIILEERGKPNKQEQEKWKRKL